MAVASNTRASKMISNSNKEETTMFCYKRWIFVPTPTDLLPLNKSFNCRWNVFAKIGDGCDGEVYAAYDRELKHSVAIKVYRHQYKLEKELEVIKKIHCNEYFCNYIFHQKTSVTKYIVMDLKGPKLTQLISHFKQLSLNTVFKIGLKMLNAVEVLHREGFVHNDIKTDNFVIGMSPDETSKIFLVDFSFSKRLRDVTAKRRPLLAKNNVYSDLYRVLQIMLEMRTPRSVVTYAYLTSKAKPDILENLIKTRLGTELVSFKRHLEHYGSAIPNYGKLQSYIKKQALRDSIDFSSLMEWEENPNDIWESMIFNKYEDNK